MCCNAAASQEARESVGTLEKELEGLKEEIDDLKKVPHSTCWQCTSRIQEHSAFSTVAMYFITYDCSMGI